MPIVRLSGTVTGAQDPNREIRARILYRLYASGWDIYNSNGDQQITLANIERKIIESNAFIFMPGASLQDLFKAVSIFVGYQTLDPNLAGKATVIMNSDQSWTPLFRLLEELQNLGTIKQNYHDFLLTANEPDDVFSHLERVRVEGIPEPGRHKIAINHSDSYDTPAPEDSLGNVCVFCSASIEEAAYLEDGYNLGKSLAENKYGCVSGAGTTGVMGAVVRGAVDAGGWAGGSNVPHIIELEGLPDGLSSFWLKPDIYTRMEVMIEHSNAFVIFPGGSGTVQELLTLLIFKQSDHPSMKNKPIVIFNRPVAGTKNHFWDSLIALLEPWHRKEDYTIVDDLGSILPAIAEELA